MVIMHVEERRARRGSLSAVLVALAALPASVALFGCTTGPATTASDAVDVDPDGGAVTPLLDAEPGDGRALVSTLEAAADVPPETAPPASSDATDSSIDVGGSAGSSSDGDTTTDDTTTGEGTDSVTRSSLAAPPSLLRSNLIEFGSAYLGYDYRLDHQARTERFQGLTSDELFEELAVPLPPVLAERLVDERRVILAEFVSIEPVDVGVYQLAFAVTESSEGDGGDVPTNRTITVAVDLDDLVIHVS